MHVCKCEFKVMQFNLSTSYVPMLYYMLADYAKILSIYM